MKTIKTLPLLLTMMLFSAFAMAQQSKVSEPVKNSKMKTYVIEREVPNVGASTADQLKSISQTSCNVLKEMKGIEWVHSYVTGNKIYCIYRSENEQLIREHAKKGGFPANAVSEVATMISPATAQ